MLIKYSRYSAPFTEKPVSGVHFISLDDQRDMALGFYDAHVRLYQSIPRSRCLEVYDPLTGSIRFYEMSGPGFFRPFNPQPSVDLSDLDRDFLLSLKASRVKSSVPLLSRCSCGNSSRPWRCKCHK